MEKAKSYGVMLLIAVAGSLVALKIYEQMNKPKVALPATAPTTPAGS
jgi:hypothetical protein